MLTVSEAIGDFHSVIRCQPSKVCGGLSGKSHEGINSQDDVGDPPGIGCEAGSPVWTVESAVPLVRRELAIDCKLVPSSL